MDLILKQCVEPLPPLNDSVGLTPDRQSVIERLTAKKPDERFRNYDELIAEIEQTYPKPDELAGPSYRFTASLIELSGLSFVKFWVGWAILMHYGMNRTDWRLWSDTFIGILYYAIYVFGIAKFGTTPVKWLFGLRVVSCSGGLPSLRNTLLRLVVFSPTIIPLFILNIISQIPFEVPWTKSLLGSQITMVSFSVVPILLYLVSIVLMNRRSDRRALHDLVAGTEVIRIPPEQRPLRRRKRVARTSVGRE